MFILVAALLTQAPLDPARTEMPANHPAVPPSAAAPPGDETPGTDELMKRLEGIQNLAEKDKSFEVASSLGRLYVAHGRYADAIAFLEQAAQKAEKPAALFLQLRQKAKAQPLPAVDNLGCRQKPSEPLEEFFNRVNKDGAAKPAETAACLGASLQPFVEVVTLLGNSYFLQSDSIKALSAFERALEISDAAAEARYGRAALLLDTRGDDLPSLKKAQADFSKFIKDQPSNRRVSQARALLAFTESAISEGGVSKLRKKSQPTPTPTPTAPPLADSTIKAFQQVERTQELDARLQKLIEEGERNLATGQFQAALDAYKQVMPLQPDNARLRAGMAWSLVRLDKPMASRVWTVALENPAAIDALGDTLKKNGDAAGAKALWQRLKESAPAYASKLEGKLAQ